MQRQRIAPVDALSAARNGADATGTRLERREKTLQTALRKRAAGVPTYTVPEAAALLSVSHEHLYRLIRADAFPALDMRRHRDQGRYVVPAQAVEEMLTAATESAALVKTLGFRPAGGVA